MQSVIIADTSCLILLDKIGEFNLLKAVFGRITVTQEIAEEFGHDLPEWFCVVETVNKTYQRILEASLDRGEASTIAFAVENPNSLLIIDDQKGRNYAQQLGIQITGTLGVFFEAKAAGCVPSVEALLNRMKETDFRITPELELQILLKAGER